MRTIKFRGVRTENSEMIYGQLAYFFDNPKSAMIMPKCYFGTRDFDEEDENGNPVIEDAAALGGYYSVKPETVGQFTGLLDKNGREIYEGDILKGKKSPYSSRSPRTHDVVIWHGNGWKRESYNGSMKVIPEIDCREMEVIGNIHENPELLQQ